MEVNSEKLLCPTGHIDGIDIPVSRIFFGATVRPVTTCDLENAYRILDTAVAYGLNAFDTAYSYGRSEETLGHWMKERNNRNKVVIQSKVGDVNRDGSVHIDREVITNGINTGLERLQTDYIDIYLLHRDDPKTPVSEIIDTLSAFQDAGKILRFGASNWTHERIAEANAYAEANGKHGFTVSSPYYGIARQVADVWNGGCVGISGPENKEARAWYEKNQMPVVSYSALSHHFFAGRFKSYDYEAADQVLDRFGKKGYLSEDNMYRLKVAEEIAEKTGLTVAQVAVRFVLSSKMNGFAIASMSKEERIRDNVIAAMGKLTEEEIRALEADGYC